MCYNDYLKFNNLDNQYSLVSDGEKIKWIYLKSNPLQIQAMAFRDNGEDPNEVLQYIEKYIDLEKIFDSEMDEKLQDFYTALNWGPISTKINQNSSRFFN